MEDFEKIVIAQFDLINKFMINANYIFQHDIEQRKEEPELLFRGYLHYIARLVSDDTLIILYKLLNKDQHHSFIKLKNKVELGIGRREFAFKSDINEKAFNEFLRNLKVLKKLYDDLDYEAIRNKYIGHLDKKRYAIAFELTDLRTITDLLKKITLNLNKVFYNVDESLINEENVLMELLSDNIQLNKTLQSN